MYICWQIKPCIFMSKKSLNKPRNSRPKKKKSSLAKGLNILWKSIIAFFVGTIVMVIVYGFAPVPGTPLMLIRKWENRNNDKHEIQYKWVSRDNISNYLELAVVCSEDQNFLKHNGLDFGAIKKAQKQNEKAGRVVRGASTISQQTAKNLFLWPGRSYVRKGLEVYFTFLIELFWSKERIMEVYLNIIEMGDGVYGAQAASKKYFKKDAAKLSASEAALIAAVLPNPRRFSASKPSAYTRGRQAFVLQQMRFWGMKLDYDKEKKD